MKHNPDYFKRQAKTIKKSLNIPHNEALDEAVKRAGFKSWEHFIDEQKEE